MNFDDLLNDIEQLIKLPLKAITETTADITILSIDRKSGRYVVKSEDSKRELKRNIRELEAIYLALTKDGYCNVEQALQGSFTSRHQPETIFANLPYIQYFKFERRKHLVLREGDFHSLGVTQELPSREQRQIRRTLAFNKNFSIGLLASELDETLANLDNEIRSLHIKQPGFLVDTNIRNVLENLTKINQSIQSATVSFGGSNSEGNDSSTDLARDVDFDMSDLVDLSSLTGVDDGSELDSEEGFDDELENEEDDSELIVPNIRRQTPTLYALYQRLTYEEIEIQPDYQRKDRIWKDEKKSKLIESILMGLPLPIFYFGERKNDNWVVIDGLQRITTVQDFMMGDFPLKLDKDSPVYEANGKFFTDFDRKLTRLINEFEITAYVIEMEEEPKDSGNVNQFIIELFHRINTYGVKLSEQEIRSAINFGSSVFYLKFLASSSTFIAATNNTVNPKRQKDLKVCLSGLAFLIFGYKNFRSSKYDDFLNKTMNWINSQNFQKITNENDEVDYKSESPAIVSLTSRFESSLNYNLELFGESAFKKNRNQNRKEPVSKTLFEVLVTLFANINEKQKEIIREKKDKFIDCLYDAIQNDSKEYAEWMSPVYQNSDRGLHYALSTSTGKKVTINYRFEAIMNILEETTGCIINIQPIAH
ncbi:DUF262 domain-containing protein [Marinomonas mediterranea]|jgi:Protein of unknown function DUF262.|uniref:GmrSD restriction endonucleases N-terminal domain-containing protein n=1 Tax=Marinomonas mediterranea (strain ATCC 700492 / JCM 21426 / NBRC 103028 / MMB-1) TaxID=717774 RepID=F2K3V2_MARM1|nr:DUF262 domain-containing protein [Marinomonas mediterranea]ADZ90201.1 protein of unknown function DUF262 [Marinomonas mediterranea MMB-1]WCN16400.1 DUF262 domain-containing protein [Marinomonas mediterranea MMB-1]